MRGQEPVIQPSDKALRCDHPLPVRIHARLSEAADGAFLDNGRGIVTKAVQKHWDGFVCGEQLETAHSSDADVNNRIVEIRLNRFRGMNGIDSKMA